MAAGADAGGKGWGVLQRQELAADRDFSPGRCGSEGTESRAYLVSSCDKT